MDPQLSLAMELPASSPAASKAMQPAARVAKRFIESEPILWMRDVLQLTGVHRSTIHRWMENGRFPKKDAPKGRPIGWLRSTYDRWLLGPTAPARVARSHEEGPS